VHSFMFDFRKQCLNSKNIHVPVLIIDLLTTNKNDSSI
jgi:hypothetical protein